MRWLVRIVLGLVFVTVFGFLAVRWQIERQGSPIAAIHKGRPRVHASADYRGVATIRGRTWDEILEAEGYFVASERMFQMDLMRRAGSGRLAAWFGARALPLDKRRLEEDWPTVAARAYAELPADEKAALDAYTAGVNRFIRDRSGQWGVEYTLLRVEPEPWTGADSMAILLTMAEELSSSAPGEALEGRWRAALSDAAWAELLFTLEHPWNEPMFGAPRRPTLPARALPPTPLSDDEGFEVSALGPDAGEERSAYAAWTADVEPLRALLPLGLPSPSGPLPASNSWAYCGDAGCFLANDPHLGYGVPELWVAVVLQRVDDFAATPPPAGDEWAAGVAIPGLPGLVLGMNAHLAWAFTNTGEDVDDLLPEQLSPDRTQYLVRRDGDREVWAPLITRTATIEVRDQKPVNVTVVATHRGPLLTREGLIVDHARQWLPLKTGMLRLPVHIPRARSWEEMNLALDAMKVPAQNVLILDREGNIGYRTSGTGVMRQKPGRASGSRAPARARRATSRRPTSAYGSTTAPTSGPTTRATSGCAARSARRRSSASTTWSRSSSTPRAATTGCSRTGSGPTRGRSVRPAPRCSRAGPRGTGR